MKYIKEKKVIKEIKEIKKIKERRERKERKERKEKKEKKGETKDVPKMLLAEMLKTIDILAEMLKICKS